MNFRTKLFSVAICRAIRKDAVRACDYKLFWLAEGWLAFARKDLKQANRRLTNV